VSRRGPSKADQKAARKRDRAEDRARESAEWDEHMVLDPAQLRALLTHLDVTLRSVDCDHTFRLTKAWASDNGQGWARLEPSLTHFGGTCDCKVLENANPEARVDTWARY
jgi:hypothetical protein